MRNARRGYAIGIAIGFPLGLATNRSGYIRDTIGALALGLQTLPGVCWVPLALLGFGQTETTMPFVVVSSGPCRSRPKPQRNVQPIYVRADRIMGSEGFNKWTRAILPASLPFVVSSMKQGGARHGPGHRRDRGDRR
jgi:NitT/TauT family transport system permease protein